jgi:hypothetical protein
MQKEDREVQSKAWFLIIDSREIQQMIKDFDILEASNKSKIRKKLFELCEDLIILDPKFASKAKVDEILWNYAIYSRIEELKAKLRKV